MKKSWLRIACGATSIAGIIVDYNIEHLATSSMAQQEIAFWCLVASTTSLVTFTATFFTWKKFWRRLATYFLTSIMVATPLRITAEQPQPKTAVCMCVFVVVVVGTGYALWRFCDKYIGRDKKPEPPPVPPSTNSPTTNAISPRAISVPSYTIVATNQIQNQDISQWYPTTPEYSEFTVFYGNFPSTMTNKCVIEDYSDGYSHWVRTSYANGNKATNIYQGNFIILQPFSNTYPNSGFFNIQTNL
jgi:hypothetical protein